MGVKFQFAQKVQAFCSYVISNHEKGFNARKLYNDRKYNLAGEDPILQEDLGTEITPIDVEHAMQFFENFEKMLNGEQVTVLPYRVWLNRLRIIDLLNA